MSNQLTVRRVEFQDLDDAGNPDGPPTFGVVASDNYEMAFRNDFSSMEELEAAIEKTGCGIMGLVAGFDGCQYRGKKNFTGPFEGPYEE